MECYTVLLHLQIKKVMSREYPSMHPWVTNLHLVWSESMETHDPRIGELLRKIASTWTGLYMSWCPRVWWDRQVADTVHTNSTYLIDLWWPSKCHSAFGCGTLYMRREMGHAQRSALFTGSTLCRLSRIDILEHVCPLIPMHLLSSLRPHVACVLWYQEQWNLNRHRWYK